MSNRQKKIALVALSGCIAVGFAHNRAASDETPVRPYIKPHGSEIELHGYVKGVDEKNGTFILYVDSFTFPGDKQRSLPSQRAKLIRVPAHIGRGRMLDLETSKEISLKNLQSGRKASVVGTDTGWRKELDAREVLVSGPKVSGTPTLPFGEIDEKDLAIAKQQEEIAQLRAELEQLKAALKNK